MPDPRPGRATPREPSVYDAALRLLGVRARSEAELVERLGRRFDPTRVEPVMERLRREGLLDDRDFAAQWVRQRHATHARGRVALRNELRAKGIDAQLAEEVLADIDDGDEYQRACDFAATKLDRLAPAQREQLGERDYRDRVTRRLVGQLARRGYGPSLAYSVATDTIGRYL